MLLTTFLFLTLLFTTFTYGAYRMGKRFAIAMFIGALGFMILGLTMLSDGRGIVVEDGKTIITENKITENKTTGQIETRENIQYEEISGFITQFLQLSTLLAGLTLFYTTYSLYYDNEPYRPVE